MLIKLNCQCGTRYSFDAEPVNGRMPFRVACPSCGADGTEAANELIAKTAPAQPAPQHAAEQAPLVPQVPAQEKPKLRVAGSKLSVAAPAHAAAAPPIAAATPGVEMCNRHLDKPAAAHCTVCQKPICPECMSMFGYLCSVNCRYQAEQQGIQVPKYKFQKRSVESRAFRKGALITTSVIVVIFTLIGFYYWYEFTGSKPKLAYTLKLENGNEVHSQFLGDNQLLIVSSDRAYVRDIKSDKDVWSADLKDAPTPSKPQDAAAASDDEDTSYGFGGFGNSGRPRVVVDADNIWVCFNNRVKRLDRKTGEVKNTIPLTGQLIQFTPTDSNILLVSAPSATHRLLTRIDIPGGTVTTTEADVPRPSKKTLKGELPVNVLPTAAVLLHQELEDREQYRPQVIQTSSEFFASGENLVELRVRLVTPKSTAVETMKKKGPTVINGQLSASSSSKAVAEEIFNDLKRSETGGFKKVDESTYLVTLRRYAGKDQMDWTNNVIGVPVFFAFKTVDLIVANKQLIAFDKQNKKLFEATLSYGLSEDYLRDTHSAPPGVEMDNVLYFYDQGLLTAFELPTGNVRWRLPTVGITCLQADPKGLLYINTSSAAPEDIQYSDQIKMDKTDAVILKVDPKSGKTLWKSVNHGQQCFLSGKYLFATSSFIGGLAMGNALRDALGMATSGPSYFHIYRIDPSNGELIWDYSNNKDGAPNEIDFQNNKMALNYDNEIRVMKILDLF